MYDLHCSVFPTQKDGASQNIYATMKIKLPDITIKSWATIGLFNLLLVATLGLLMRLKIILPLPFINQQHILHAHSHFAFSGWISQILMLLLAMAALGGDAKTILPSRYQWMLWSNLIAAYGMLATFSWQGYGAFSIAFSTSSVLISYSFATFAWRDINSSTLSLCTRRWFKAALIFLALSSLGTFYLAYLMKNGNVDPKKQLSAVYFYLHFQYNGWFFLMCMGLASYWFRLHQISIKNEKWIQTIFILGCVPAYMLSILWYDLPIILYVLLVCVVILQITAWFLSLHALWKNKSALKSVKVSPTTKILLYAVVIAASTKFILQAFSVIPSLSVLAYSFRPIVIGYLHLVLLGIITLSLLAYSFQTGIFRNNKLAYTAIIGFVCGIVLNEVLLMTQGLGGMVRIYVPHIPTALAGAAVIMMLSLLLLCIAVGRYNSTKAIETRIKEQ